MAQFDRPIQRSMSLGELSPNLATRADLDRWRASLALCQNCATIPQGGATERSGTQLILEALAGSALYEFRYSRSDGYAIEAGANLFRFFRDFGVIESAPGVPYTLATPFAAGEAPNLCMAQSADWTYITSGARVIQKLQRFGHTNWTIGDAPIKNGPFMDDNKDITAYLYTTSSAELTAGTSFTLKCFPPAAAVFTADNIGGMFLIREQDERRIQPWQTDLPYSVNDFTRNAGNVYKDIRLTGAGDHSGPNAPIHTDGAAWDGAQKGNLWQYCHSGFGVVQITAFTSASQVTATVLSYVPADIQASETVTLGVVTAIGSPSSGINLGGSNRWAEGAWSNRRGFPRIVVLHQDRLIAYSTPFQPSTYWGSGTDDYENFLAGSDADLGFSRQVAVGDGVSEILFAISSSLGLFLGTTGPEVVTRSLSNTGYLKPDDIQDISAAQEGAAAVRPRVVDTPVYVTADGLRICEIDYDPNSTQPNAYKSSDLTIFADHITQSGVLGLAWQRDPYRLLWAYRTDGMLIALTYRPDQQVMGWHRHPTTLGSVNSLASVPSPNAQRQDLWLRVTRALPAGAKTYIECMRPFFEKTPPDAQGKLYAIDGWFVDCGLMYNGAPIDQFDGLAAFNGVNLRVFADGKWQGDLPVAAGTLKLKRAASQVLVGLPMDARVRTLAYDRNSDGGANSGRKVRTPEPTAYLRNSCNVRANALLGDRTEPMKPLGGQTMGASPDLFTGVAKASVASDWDQGGVVEFNVDGPFPMTILAITPVTEVAVT